MDELNLIVLVILCGHVLGGLIVTHERSRPVLEWLCRKYLKEDKGKKNVKKKKEKETKSP
jgi:hypothetical protein